MSRRCDCVRTVKRLLRQRFCAKTCRGMGQHGIHREPAGAAEPTSVPPGRRQICKTREDGRHPHRLRGGLQQLLANACAITENYCFRERWAELEPTKENLMDTATPAGEGTATASLAELDPYCRPACGNGRKRRDHGRRPGIPVELQDSRAGRGVDCGDRPCRRRVVGIEDGTAAKRARQWPGGGRGDAQLALFENQRRPSARGPRENHRLLPVAGWPLDVSALQLHRPEWPECSA